MTSPIVTNRSECLSARIKLIRNLYRIAYDSLGSHGKALSVLLKARNLYRKAFRQSLYNKVAKVDGRYFFHFYSPGLGSPALDLVQADEINRIAHYRPGNTLRILLLAITTRCPLNCEHCFEWHNLRQKETMSREDLLSIVRKYQAFGTGMVFFSGGEPLLRTDDIIYVLGKSDNSSDFWIYTSGFLMDRKKAHKLKDAGLTGVMISLDHHLAEAHDSFRGKEGVYAAAINAVTQAKDAGLVTGLALCPSREYTNENNIRGYMELARELGVAFVQILEPREAGRYIGQDVMLSTAQSRLLDALCDEYNTSFEFRSYPIVRSPAATTRRLGCTSGDRSIYVNSKGMIQKCPFCTRSYGHVLERNPADVLKEMRSESCPAVSLYQPDESSCIAHVA